MDERDQDVQRTPLWPPDPEPGSEAPRPPTPAPAPEQAQAQEPEQMANWAATWAEDSPPAPSDVASPYQPYQPYPEATNPPMPSWPSLDDPWEEQQLAESSSPLSDAPTTRISAAPAPSGSGPLLPPFAPSDSPSDAPTQQLATAPTTPSDAPTQHIVAPTTPSDAPTEHIPAAPPPALSDAPTEHISAAPPGPVIVPPDAPTPPARPPATPPATPPAPPATPPAPPARKQSGALWRLGVVLVICALLLTGALSVYSHASALAAEPQQLMTKYCAAITHDDYRAAYSLLSASAQAQQPEAQYLADAAARDSIEGPITACAAKPTQALSALSFLRAPRSLIFNAQITRTKTASGQIALTRDAQGWHVAALSSPLQGIDLGPLATQQALCKAFNTRAYSQAYALLSTPYQHEQGSATAFAKSFGNTLTVTACAANLKTYSVNSADQQATFDVTLTLSFVGATSGSPPTAFTLPTKFSFVREATGWRVDDIKPLLTQ